MSVQLISMLRNAFRQALLLTIPGQSSPWPPLAPHPLATQGARVLPPFLGEMGLEIRGFLGMVEPWLRAGWKIPAKRPCFYPTQAAFADPEYFARIDLIKRDYGLSEMVGRLAAPYTPNQSLDINVSNSRTQAAFSIKTAGVRELENCGRAERELRRAFLQRYGHAAQVTSFWDFQSLSLYGMDDALLHTSRWAIPPSYRPNAFGTPPTEAYPHVGLQVRAVPGNPERDSDPLRMRRLAESVAALLGVPVLVYGNGRGTRRVEGHVHIADLWDETRDTLQQELGWLATCRLMVSPDSGWTDLMAWLRIPTLLELQHFAWGFEGLRPFRPRIALEAQYPDLATLVCKLAAEDDTVLPSIDACRVQVSHLHPQSEVCRKYWQEFVGDPQAGDAGSCAEGKK